MNSPELLWHYTTQRGLLGIADSRSLWATDVLYLNDSTEFTYAIELCLSVLEGFDTDAQAVLRPALEPLRRGLGWELSFRICVASFSEHGDLLSQWRAYSEPGGLSLAFEASRLTALDPSLNLRLEKCVYDRALQEQQVHQLLSDVMAPKGGDEDSAEKRQRRCRARVTKLAPTLKHPAFEEEREWRLISKPLGFEAPITLYRPGRSMLIPYIAIPLSGPADKLPIKWVQLGPTPHADLAWLSAQSFLAPRIEGSGGMVPIFVWNATVPYRSW